jgi:iron complex outermembrane receptor protein
VSEVDTGLLLEDRRTSSRSASENVHLNLGARLQWRLGAGGDSLIVSPGLFANRGENAFRFDTVHLRRREEPPAYADYGSGANQNSFFGPRVQLQYRQRLGDWRVEGGGTLRSSRARNFNTRDEFSADTTALRSQEDRSVGREKGLQLNAKGSRTLGGGRRRAQPRRRHGSRGRTARRHPQHARRWPARPGTGSHQRRLLSQHAAPAAYAQDEWSLNQHWAFHAGLRWEGITTRGDNGQGGRPENRNSVTTPLVHLLWKPDPKTRDQVRLSLTRSWRAPATAALIGRPAINRLYDPGIDRHSETNPDSAGNPNLRPELATGIDLAFERYLQGGGLLSANLFHRRISDLMRSTVELETVTWSPFPRYVRRNRNIGNATTQGLELESKFRLDQLLAGSPPVEMRANLALFRSEVEGVPGPDNRLDQQSKATGNVGADYRLRGTPLTLGGNVNWVPATLTRLAADETTSTTSKRQWDMFALWTFSPSVGLRLMANNVLPRDYATETFNDSDPDGAGALPVERTRNLSGGPSHVNLQLRLELKL